MKVIALTGGIATGKSTFARHFLQLEPRTAFFDSDAAVSRFLTSPAVAATINASLGGNLLDESGDLVKSRLRDLVFSDARARQALEAILHPMVRAECSASLDSARSSMEPWFLMDVPLLYESNFPIARDLELVVACGPQTQKSRLITRNSLPPETADRMLSAQLPIAEKVRRADVVIWNGGLPDSLARQTQHFIVWLKKTLRQ
jgi:dephospho-CoA kinase